MLKRVQVSLLRDVFCVCFVPRYGASSAVDALVMPADEELKQAGFPCNNTSHDGFIEMLVGVGILSPRTRLSSYAASAWLLAIAGNLWLNEDYDVVRDVNMALAGFALGQLSGARDEEAQAEPAQLQKAA